MKYRIVTFIIVLAFINIVLSAQNKPTEYNFSYLTIDNGLCDNSIHAIHKDKNSFMWIGTSNGLDRYDGYDIKHYTTVSVLPQRFIDSNYIYDIEEDDYHNLWIASDAGILRIDLQNENIDYFNDFDGANKDILSTPVQSIYIDEFQNLWIGSNDRLAYVTLNENRKIKDIAILKNGVSVNTFIKHGNDIWVGGKNLLIRYSFLSADRYFQVPYTSDLDLSSLTINALLSFGDYLWIGTQAGLYCLNTQSNHSTPYRHNPADPKSISSNFIMDIAKNDSGDIIIATRNGVNIFQRDEHFVQFGKESGSMSLNNTIINKVFVDEKNCIWAGSDFGGVNIIAPKQIHFSHSLQTEGNDNPFIVSSVLEDNEGNLLVGIVDGGLAIKRKNTDTFAFYKHRSDDPFSLSNNNISDIVQDFQGDYWISTIGGGIDKLSKNKLSNPTFDHYSTKNSGLLSDEIYDLYLDSVRNSIWICSSKHIQQIDFATGRINRLLYYTRSMEVLDNMNTLFIDSQSRLWIGGNGIYIIDLKDYRNGYECIYYKHKLDDPDSKVNEKITCILETNDKEIYLGSMGNGIYKLDRSRTSGSYSFINYGTRSGLSDLSISNLLEDENGNIWISTLRGIYMFNPYTKKAIKFDEKEGLQVQQFYKKSGYKTKEHRMVLGTTNGIVSFNPIINLPKKIERRVTLTNLLCNGQEMVPYLHRKNLSTSIIKAKEFHLYPPQNSFELAFSSLDYIGQDKVFYFHRIQELDKKANTGLTKRNAKYTNLNPGKYTFEVWCTNYDNTWSSERTYLSIVVHPPFYQTNWFYSIIAFLCFAIVYYIIYWYTQRQKNVQQLLKEKIEERTSALISSIAKLENTQSDIVEKNEQLQLQNEEIIKQKNEIYEMSLQMEKLSKDKISYFTNVAHEFKTPLTLIIGPTEQLIKHIGNTELKENLEMINRNARYLLSMVNQLIDLQRLDTKNISTQSGCFDLVQLINQTVNDFYNLIQGRQIHFETFYRLQSNLVISDKENIHKILYNLLSNAVKYTPDKGKITLHAGHFTDRSGILNQYISVSNSGSVIAKEEIEKIFNRFYRIHGQHKYVQFGQSSTGIGLHIVKELISLLNGAIFVKSSPKTGVSFRFYFPISLSEKIENEKDREIMMTLPVEDIIAPFIPIDRDKPNLLLVEDNPDMRHYIKKMLSAKFNVAEANNGQTGYETAKKILPDFIVSDLMMPICNGADLCRKIRENEELCHIPFILLTANTSEQAFIESYENGIDGYITKPFEESVLMAQIDAIIKNRDLRQKKFLDDEMNLSILDVGKSDQQFMNEVMLIIEKNFNDPSFGVKELVFQLKMSYTLIYKKFVTITGVPPVRFLLLYRLKIAKHILEKNRNNNVIVSEIAYRVGFNDPKYFTRCFVKQYNMTPSSIIYQE